MLVSTTPEVAGHRVAKTLGLVQGYTTRASPSGGFLSTRMAGGPNLDEAQAASFETMVKRAESLGANAIIGVQYNLACPESGFMSFICYGTAVVVEKC
mgnify:CR=1 FL=1|tara:strand:+ start:748 stop:1041 length:294 start_codon:yes stop_codon:yes gene_type:complete